MTHKTTTLTVQKWGNSLALRIPAAIARSAHFHLGTLVELDVHGGNILIKPTGPQKPSLDERLASFDPKKHSGEMMAVEQIGREKF